MWGYNIGDTVRFVSTNPYRLVVSGRTKHFISAFGEHVIAEEVEQAMLTVSKAFNAHVIEFTVAPQIHPQSGLPYHQWLISFDQEPDNIAAFSACLDEALRLRNIYYNDLITGGILQPLKITLLQRNAFIEYMKSLGKLGGQNKVPRLSNDRKIADALQPWLLS